MLVQQELLERQGQLVLLEQWLQVLVEQQRRQKCCLCQLQYRMSCMELEQLLLRRNHKLELELHIRMLVLEQHNRKLVLELRNRTMVLELGSKLAQVHST